MSSCARLELAHSGHHTRQTVDEIAASRQRKDNIMSLKEMVNNGQTVSFQYFRDNNLWYKTQTGFSFPVPIEDIGNATFLAEDRAILFMRYISKHLARLEAKIN